MVLYNLDEQNASQTMDLRQHRCCYWLRYDGQEHCVLCGRCIWRNNIHHIAWNPHRSRAEVTHQSMQRRLLQIGETSKFIMEILRWSGG
ncbi:hypothetical protein N9L68_00115 [bacterium]|nr:hypothetical protein [bacterium]